MSLSTIGDVMMFIALFGLLVSNLLLQKQIDSLHAWIGALTSQTQSLSRSQDLNDEQFRQVFRALSPDWQRKPKGKEWRS